MSRGSRGYEAGEVCNDLAHIYGDNPLPCHHSGRFFSLIPLGHYTVGHHHEHGFTDSQNDAVDSASSHSKTIPHDIACAA